ncbi:peptide deformylase [Blochmannia endosymbiont of Camponotus (Colobopsis) obliquus]|uniref:peptide deformylase n=1 Tax=Blochmannia endosymbiont of Camponotus (Colobopsis) obliquus TaxID=1505597 RepID=UPI00061A5800|nr:peptide deformylase [Blochmannia endosymbiont of Camponotus (Colobopsis) obliquus]AKC60389.1 peptide deformylase [Blochmannia endosymbiont of Camponotus (Colobopsis) obliquus]
MSILELLYYPDKRLRNIATPVINFNNNTKQIVNNMLETMYKNKGIGLAATQVNIHKQIIVIDISTTLKKPLILINPRLIKKQGNTSIIEGCLSIPQQHYAIPRAAIVKIHAFNQHGDFFKIQANNLLAICIQHEMDHLIGKLLIDYLN